MLAKANFPLQILWILLYDKLFFYKSEKYRDVRFVGFILRIEKVRVKFRRGDGMGN